SQSVRFRDEGRGSTVLVLPACPSKPQHYSALVARLAAKHRVIQVELPGYGDWGLREPGTTAGVSLAIARHLDELGVREIDVVGHSLGGYRALHLAVSTAIDVRTIVTLGGFADLGERRQLYPTLAEMAARDISGLADAFMPSVFAPGYAAAHPQRAAE